MVGHLIRRVITMLPNRRIRPIAPHATVEFPRHLPLKMKTAMIFILLPFERISPWRFPKTYWFCCLSWCAVQDSSPYYPSHWPSKQHFYLPRPFLHFLIVISAFSRKSIFLVIHSSTIFPTTSDSFVPLIPISSYITYLWNVGTKPWIFSPFGAFSSLAII